MGKGRGRGVFAGQKAEAWRGSPGSFGQAQRGLGDEVVVDIFIFIDRN